MDRITKAVAEYHGWNIKRKAVVIAMDAATATGTLLEDRFYTVGRLHGHFSHGQLSQSIYAGYMIIGSTFIEDLLNHPQTLAIP